MRHYLLLLLSLTLAGGCKQPGEALADGFEVLDQNGRRQISYAGQPILVYQMEDTLPAGLPPHYRRGGFFHPVYSPAGIPLTDDFPVGHEHQHGIFMAWVNTTFRGEFTDFWNQQKLTGTVLHVSSDSGQITDNYYEFYTTLVHQSLAAGPVLSEQWTVRIHPPNTVSTWELISEQTNVTDDTLYLNAYHYGGLGVRGRAEWNAADSLHFTNEAQFLTASGKNRSTANHQRENWCAIYGAVGVDTAGLAVIPHPDNYNDPQPVRVHPEMPYFSFTPVVDHPFSIAPGATYRSVYRFVSFDGVPPVEILNQLSWPKE